jgi:hypothetical protein
MPTLDQLKQAVTIAEQIEKLQTELASLFGGSPSVVSVPQAAAVSPTKKRGKRTMSPEAREKIAAAQRARWAKAKGSASPAKVAKAPRKTRGLTPEGRAKLAAAMKARWAARKKGAPALNASAKAGTGGKTTQKKANKTTTIYR